MLTHYQSHNEGPACLSICLDIFKNYVTEKSKDKVIDVLQKIIYDIRTKDCADAFDNGTANSIALTHAYATHHAQQAEADSKIYDRVNSLEQKIAEISKVTNIEERIRDVMTPIINNAMTPLITETFNLINRMLAPYVPNGGAVAAGDIPNILANSGADTPSLALVLARRSAMRPALTELSSPYLILMRSNSLLWIS